MNLFSAVRLAFGSIMTNKLRSFLTMIGVTIGVAAVIALVAIGQGTQRQIRSQIESLGSYLLTVNIRGRGADVAMTYREARDLTSDLPQVVAAAPVVSSSVTTKYGTREHDTNLLGTDQNLAVVRGMDVERGRFLAPLDVECRQRVAVLGQDVVRELFGFADPIGQEVKINGISFLVVGVLAPQGTSMMGSGDDQIIVPVTAARQLVESSGVRTLYVKGRDAEGVEVVTAVLEQRLSRRFKDPDAFRIFSQTQMLETVTQVTSTMTLMLAAIAGISLIVGGIGVMNIMLVTVTERTREIGIRKAIGARNRDILRQFLIESAVLGSLGGSFGIVMGLLLARLAGRAIGVTAVASPLVVGGAFVFSAGVGILFGVYPATRAARLDPIQALRFE
ncbi:MAG TPA: FtsX-like permease family protein [Clostridia bacterium]|nr:FtsX-like permease family protein [Clostridia bacterium]